jgi:hypothetical protein
MRLLTHSRYEPERPAIASRAPLTGFIGVVAGVLGVAHALVGSAHRSSGAVTNSMRMAALSTAFEPAC